MIDSLSQTLSQLDILSHFDLIRKPAVDSRLPKIQGPKYCQ